MPLGTRCHQGTHSHEVVGGRREGHDPIDERTAPMAQLPQSANRLQPAEDLLDQLPLPLTDLVTGMPCGPAVDGAVADLLRDVGGAPPAPGPRRRSAPYRTPCRRRPYDPAARSPPASRPPRRVRRSPLPRSHRRWRRAHAGRRAGHGPDTPGSPPVPSPSDTAAPAGPSSTGVCRCADARH